MRKLHQFGQFAQVPSDCIGCRRATLGRMEEESLGRHFGSSRSIERRWKNHLFSFFFFGKIWSTKRPMFIWSNLFTLCANHFSVENLYFSLGGAPSFSAHDQGLQGTIPVPHLFFSVRWELFPYFSCLSLASWFRLAEFVSIYLNEWLMCPARNELWRSLNVVLVVSRCFNMFQPISPDDTFEQCWTPIFKQYNIRWSPIDTSCSYPTFALVFGKSQNLRRTGWKAHLRQRAAATSGVAEAWWWFGDFGWTKAILLRNGQFM